MQTTGEDGQGLPELLLTGDLPDQSALLGVLMRLHNLNLALVSFRRLPAGNETGQQQV